MCEETVGSITEPILIDTILQAHCAAEAHEIYYDEKLYAEKAVAIRHKPNELTAILETGERYLLTLNGVVKRIRRLGNSCVNGKNILVIRKFLKCYMM